MICLHKTFYHFLILYKKKLRLISWKQKNTYRVNQENILKGFKVVKRIKYVKNNVEKKNNTPYSLRRVSNTL